VRPEKLIPQLNNQKLFNFRSLALGIFIFTIGLFFKIVIADNIADYANPKFSNPKEYSNDELLFTWILFSQQIFYDFNAYTLMAIGVSKTLCVDLPENFNSPYLSQSLSEFWRNWHITLSNWIKDFIYIPLGGSRKSFFRNNLNILISMIISGIWHGSGLNFIFWGALNGVILCLEKILLIKIYQILPAFLRVIFIYLLITYLWLFFRVYNIDDIFIFHRALLEFNLLNIKLILLFIIILLFNFFQKYMSIQYLENFFNKKNKLVIFTSSIIFMIFLLMSKTSTERFIYFNF
jgi:D-alanyl-lipoteichoic acid acyltransferase DltB (MBOAT superfamily)